MGKIIGITGGIASGKSTVTNFSKEARLSSSGCRRSRPPTTETWWSSV